jgi:hypothetical protein
MRAYELGVPMAEAGETRPSRFRTPLATLPGHEGGIVFYAEGDALLWMMAREWEAWIAETKAGPAVIHTDDPMAEIEAL